MLWEHVVACSIHAIQTINLSSLRSGFKFVSNVCGYGVVGNTTAFQAVVTDSNSVARSTKFSLSCVDFQKSTLDNISEQSRLKSAENWQSGLMQRSTKPSAS